MFSKLTSAASVIVYVHPFGRLLAEAVSPFSIVNVQTFVVLLSVPLLTVTPDTSPVSVTVKLKPVPAGNGSLSVVASFVIERDPTLYSFTSATVLPSVSEIVATRSAASVVSL